MAASAAKYLRDMNMSDENRIEGTLRDVGGKVQDIAGGLTGDSATQARGRVNAADRLIAASAGFTLRALTHSGRGR